MENKEMCFYSELHDQIHFQDGIEPQWQQPSPYSKSLAPILHLFLQVVKSQWSRLDTWWVVCGFTGESASSRNRRPLLPFSPHCCDGSVLARETETGDHED